MEGPVGIHHNAPQACVAATTVATAKVKAQAAPTVTPTATAQPAHLATIKSTTNVGSIGT